MSIKIGLQRTLCFYIIPLYCYKTTAGLPSPTHLEWDASHFHAYLDAFFFDLLFFSLWTSQFWPNLTHLLHQNLAELQLDMLNLKQLLIINIILSNYLYHIITQWSNKIRLITEPELIARSTMNSSSIDQLNNENNCMWHIYFLKTWF